MSISFNEIPLDVRTFGSYIEFDGSRAVQGLAAQPHVALLIAQKIATGEMEPEVPYLISSADAGEVAWGRGSIGSDMARAFKKQNPYTELWGVALDDPGGATAGAWTITFSAGTYTAGNAYVYIGGKRIVVAIADGIDQDAVATAVAAGITAAHSTLEGGLPVTAAAATNVVTLTARNKGTVLNGLDVRMNYNQGEEMPGGWGLVTIAQSVPGATDPDIDDAIAAIGAVQYHTIAHAFTDATNLTAIEAELLSRWGAMVQTEGHAYTAKAGSQGTLTTLGNTRNSAFSTIFGTGLSPTPPWTAAAIVAAVDARETQIDPLRPRQTLQLRGMLPPEPDERFTRAERNILLTDGISTFVVDTGGNCLIERLISTYQTNASAIPDTTFLDVTTLRGLAYLRYSARARISSRYPRHKLADDGTDFAPGQAIVTPGSIRAELLSLFKQWEYNGYVEGFDQFAEELIVERDGTDPNRVNARLNPDLINKFIVFAGQMQFLL